MEILEVRCFITWCFFSSNNRIHFRAQHSFKSIPEATVKEPVYYGVNHVIDDVNPANDEKRHTLAVCERTPKFVILGLHDDEYPWRNIRHYSNEGNNDEHDCVTVGCTTALVTINRIYIRCFSVFIKRSYTLLSSFTQ